VSRGFLTSIKASTGRPYHLYRNLLQNPARLQLVVTRLNLGRPYTYSIYSPPPPPPTAIACCPPLLTYAMLQQEDSQTEESVLLQLTTFFAQLLLADQLEPHELSPSCQGTHIRLSSQLLIVLNRPLSDNPAVAFAIVPALHTAIPCSSSSPVLSGQSPVLLSFGLIPLLDGPARAGQPASPNFPCCHGGMPCYAIPCHALCVKISSYASHCLTEEEIQEKRRTNEIVIFGLQTTSSSSRTKDRKGGVFSATSGGARFQAN
jgi:hypothetical protein